MQNAKSGTLRCKIVEANLTRDTETFSNMDPFVKMIYNGKKQGQTVIKDGAGKKPKWNQTFELQIMDQMDEILFEVHDEDMTSSDLVGKLQCKIFNILGPNGGMDEWHTITFNNKSAGKLRLETLWQAKGGAPTATAQQASPAQNPYIAQANNSGQQQLQMMQQQNAMMQQQMMSQQMMANQAQAAAAQQQWANVAKPAGPPPGYPGAQPQYGAPPQGYPGAPPQGYPGAPPQGYPGAPPQGYPGAPPQGYPGAPPQGYPGAPPQGYPGAPPQGYPGAPPQGYPGAPPQGYPGAPPQGYPGAPPQGYPGQPPQAYGAPPQGQYPPQGPPQGQYPPQGGYQQQPHY